ncbi:MAG: Lrp/AsnC family transcriptional regulator [Methanoregulaceae archaeon]|nr:Lrp/AsnC family transcriptional regulator [Methanoregulaceae archaeon]
MPDGMDLVILNALQDEIPLVSRPWDEIARRIGLSERDLLDRLTQLQHAGILRGVSPVIESREWGLTAATLVALHAPFDRLQDIADIISGYPEVSHNFRRDHHYQIWFTLSGRDETHIRKLLSEILDRTGIGEEDVLDLPTKRKLKVDVRFSFPRSREEEDLRGPG